MIAPHLIPLPGPADDFAANLRAELPALETARCRLRAPRLEDAPHWIAILCADEAGHLGGPFDPDKAFTEFAATVGTWLLRGHGLWTVTDHSDTVLGFVLIGFEPCDAEPELGVLFLPDARGRGLAEETLRATRDHALATLRLPTLVSYTAPANHAVHRLMKRLGARPDGTIGAPSDPALIWRHHPPRVRA